MSFATVQDVATRLGRTLDATEAATVEDLLSLATGLIQGEAKQTIELVADDEVTLRGTRESTVLLPERPVVAVSSVVLNETTLTEGVDWYLEDDSLVRRSTLLAANLEEAPTIWTRGWGIPAWDLVVTYTHGYTPVPEAIRALTLSVVVRAFTNPAAAMMERLGQAQIQYAVQGSAPGLLLTADERRMVRRALGRGARSLPIH